MWGFVSAIMSVLKLKDGTYYVKIDSSLKPGFLTYGDMIVKGKVDDEILIFNIFATHQWLTMNYRGL